MRPSDDRLLSGADGPAAGIAPCAAPAEVERVFSPTDVSAPSLVSAVGDRAGLRAERGVCNGTAPRHAGSPRDGAASRRYGAEMRAAGGARLPLRLSASRARRLSLRVHPSE